jgi:hypothetical protein
VSAAGIADKLRIAFWAASAPMTKRLTISEPV